MSGDSYQAIYDAVRSRISNGDIGRAVTEAFRHVDFSHARDVVQQDFSIAASEMQRPSVLYRPALYPDGDMWCALYGEDLQRGLAGFGKSPSAAMTAFDAAWVATLAKESQPG